MSIENFIQNSHPRADLHCHTNCSDGALTPDELIERAVGYQIDMLAITDHDTVNGVDRAKRYIDEKNYSINLIPGIEISTQWHGFEIHVVGLNINSKSNALEDLIESQQSKRELRAIKMDEKLVKAGVDGVLQEAKALAGDGAITRTHFAKVILDRGAVSSMQGAFDKYIGKGKRAYVKPQWCSIAEAVDVIHESGGVAVLAHPIRYDLSPKWRRRLIVDFKHAKGNALEVILPQMNNDQRKQMVSYCLEYGLHASLGSDFHAPNRWSDLGKNLTMPDECKPVWQLWQS